MSDVESFHGDTRETLSPEVRRLEDGWAQLTAERESLYDVARDYVNGEQESPWTPRNVGKETQATRKNSITNLMPLLIDTMCEIMTVSGFRRGFTRADGKFEPPTLDEDDTFPQEYYYFQYQGMGAKQIILYRTALQYGASYLWVDNAGAEPRYVIIPSRDMVAYYEDPVNDRAPAQVIWYRSEPGNGETGEIISIDPTHVVYYDWLEDGDIVERSRREHGLGDTPVVRYAWKIDDDGNHQSLVMMNILAQNRVNTAVFTADNTTINSSFKVRWSSGLIPETRVDPRTGRPLIDPVTQQPVFKPIAVSPSRMLNSPDKDARFGTMDETPLDGFHAHIDETLREFAVRNQLPPHIFLGNLANLSAEALDAAEATFQRFITGVLMRAFAASHEDLLRLTARALGDDAGASSFGGEIRWAPFTLRSFAAVMDGLAKAVDSLGLPRRTAWTYVPGMSANDIRVAQLQREAELQEDAQLASAGLGVSSGREGNSRPTVTNDNGGNGGTIYGGPGA